MGRTAGNRYDHRVNRVPPPPLVAAAEGGARARAKPRRPDKVVIDREGAQIALRLAIGRDGLGLELARQASLACLDVVELVVRLPHVRFPFDVTGGVAKFRHKRGELERLGLELDGQRAARWAEPRLRGLLSVAPARMTIAPSGSGAPRATISIAPRGGAASTLDGVGVPALAFDVVLAPAGEDLALVVKNPRGVNLPAPPIALALRAMGALLGSAAKRSGATFVVRRLAAKLAAHLLPEAGARAPAATEMAWIGAGETNGVLFVQLARGGAPADASPEATLATELATLTAEADDRAFAGDHERARLLYLGALERAPRHAEISARIAGIDRHVGGREEAAITILREAVSTSDDATNAALLGDLLRASGDTTGAVAALLRAADHEPSSPVAALVLARAAALATDPHDALAWLDRAVARAPRIAELRWQRAGARLGAGRLGEARADYQELEALAQGADERFAVLRRAGEAHRVRGLGLTAATIFERALLYRPDDPDTLAGLGAALAAEGRAARGAAILAHAIEARTKREVEAGAPRASSAWMEVELARVLGERLDDLPAAIARLRAVPDEVPEAIDARGWEGRYRARLGDHAGAALAFARLRERAQREARAVPWLLEAAKHAESLGDLAVAQSHAGVALAIAPQDAEVMSVHRMLGERIAVAAGMRPPAIAPPPPPPPIIVEAPAEPLVEVQATAPAPPLGELLALAAEDDGALEARVEILTQRLQGDPSNEAVVDELVEGLTKLGRGLELLALLSARLEDATPERREAFLPRHREVLVRLEEEARAAGRDGEADLFKMAREASA